MKKESSDRIEIVGATANNLKNVDVSLPLRAVTLIAGVSGSGKSSLLENTLAVEANNRMRHFLGVAQEHLGSEQPDAFIGPLPATLHFSQGSFRASRRTTVGTSSGLLRLLRDLFLGYAEVWSDEADEVVPDADAASYAGWLENHHRGEIIVWSVPMRNERGNGLLAVEKLGKIGVESIVIRSESDQPSHRETGRTLSTRSFRPLSANVKHVIEGEVARLSLPSKEKLRAVLELAFSVGGAVMVELVKADSSLVSLKTDYGFFLDSDRHRVHPAVLLPFFKPSAALLSFNQPESVESGACSECEGLGVAMGVSLDRLIGQPGRSVHEGAIALYSDRGYKYINIQHETLEGLSGVEGFDPNLAWSELPSSAQQLVLFGGIDVVDRDLDTGRALGPSRPYPGIIPAILARYRKGTVTSKRLSCFIEEGPCPACRGSRWSRPAKALRFCGYSVADLLAEPFSNLLEICSAGSDFEQKVPRSARAALHQVFFLSDAFASVGLGHLSGSRGMMTVSEGESRRLRLASLLHAKGQDLALMLDEPARGLHEQDILGLVEALRELKKRHTVILNDHRFALAPAIDHVIELGPGGGEHGGQVVRQGPPGKILGTSHGDFSRRPLPITKKQPRLEVRGGRIHNLRDVRCEIPLGRLVAIAGVSGSGKSSFVQGILLPALVGELGERVLLGGVSLHLGGSWTSFKGAKEISEVVAIVQKRPESNRRSIVATYVGIADDLRKSFAALPSAGKMGLRSHDFGLNGGRGRCQRCLGIGEIQDGFDRGPCPSCGGRRFGESVLSVRLGGLNIAELLDKPVVELALDLPDWAAAYSAIFRLLVDLDLGYLTLGRRVDSLSGGEAQRLRIVEHLWKRNAKNLLLILDEPSAGLHPKDIVRLLNVLNRIVGGGENTVLLVEHHLDILRATDWIVDFGPGGGPAGGRVVAEGPPGFLASLASPTGKALSGIMGRSRVSTRASRIRQPSASAATTSHLASVAKRWLKVLVGQEVKLPSEESNFSHLGIVLDDLLAPGARPHEIGGVDRDLAWLFWNAEHSEDGLRYSQFLAAFGSHQDAKLWIAPALAAMSVWGQEVPLSIKKEIGGALKTLRLEEQCSVGAASTWRATGPRFDRGSGARLEKIVEDALVVGGGHVELRSSKGVVLAHYSPRRFALGEGYVAPIRLLVDHLRRTSQLGKCLVCKGAGIVQSLDLGLLADQSLPPLEDGFLRSPATAILKGVKRTAMIPFFRRLEKEGLWDSRSAFSKLSPARREILLFGYWCRPGHGSFLKSASSDPEEVSSWLRWDGLFAAILDEMDRSSNSQWVSEVLGSRFECTCPRCEGSGLGPVARLVTWKGRSLHDWICQGTVGELAKALREGRHSTEKERLMGRRLLKTMEPLARRHRGHPLREAVDLDSQRSCLAAAAAEALTLPMVG